MASNIAALNATFSATTDVHERLYNQKIGTTMDMRASLKASYVPPVAPSAAELQASLKGASVRVAPGTPIGVPGAQPLRIVEYPSGRPTQKQDPELTPRGRMRKPLDGGFYVR